MYVVHATCQIACQVYAEHMQAVIVEAQLVAPGDVSSSLNGMLFS